MGINCKKALKATEASHCLPDLKPQDSLLPEEDKQQLTTIYNRAALKLTGGCFYFLLFCVNTSFNQNYTYTRD